MVGKNSMSRNVFLVFNYTLFLILVILCFYPMWYVFVQSLSESTPAGRALFWPHQFTFGNYFQIFQLPGLYRAVFISVSRTVIGTSLSVLCCMWLGYLFSKEEMPFRKTLYRMLTITMYVSGGLIPFFLVMRAYGLVGSFGIYILPGLISAFHVILIKTFVEQLPASVEESAKIDGAGTVRIFFQIVFPMSLPVVATIAVFASVGHWSAWTDNLIFNAQVPELTTMQFMLHQYLNEAERLTALLQETSAEIDADFILTPRGVRMTMTMVTSIPVIMFYPILQRYFVKGLTIGAVKG